MAAPQDDEFHRIGPPVATRGGNLPHRQGGCTCCIHCPDARTCLEELQIPLNSAIGLDPASVPAASAPASGLGALLRDSLVVLTRDPAFGAAVRAVAAPEHDLVFVGAETDLASHLIADAAGVVVLDTAATVSSISELSRDLKAQFPDLVLVVAGGAAEQAALSAQVTSGDVYRFLHKPASEQRMRLFIDAAWRRRAAAEGGAATATMPQLGKTATSRRLPLGVLAMAALLVAATAGIVGWLMGQHTPERISAPLSAATPPQFKAPPQKPTDAVLSQLLERADAALARGDWLLPPGNSASELYHQALDRHPGDAQALAGLDKVVDQVLSAAEQDLLAQHLDEADHLTAAARAIAPNSVRVAFLATQIAREKDRAARAQTHLQQQQQQQEQAAEAARRDELVAAARAALTAGNLDEAARSIGVAADAGVDQDAIDRLTRDLQGAQLVARMKEPPAKATSAPALETPSATPPAESAPVSTSETAAPRKPLAAAAAETHANDIISAAVLEQLRYSAPDYPPNARASGITGWVTLAFDVEPDGSVTHVAVVAAEPKDVFDAAAVSAVRRWRYRPAEREGHPIEQRAQLRIRFTLQ
jgi:periplasmic protein TonB